MVAVRRNIAVRFIHYLLRMVVGEKVPNGLALVVGVPSALDLVGGGADSPEKVAWKATHTARRTAAASARYKIRRIKIQKII